MPSESIKNKIRISVTIMPSIDSMLTKIANKSGKSKSSLVEFALSRYLKSKFEEDMKTLSRIKFNDLPGEDDWLQIQSKD